MNITKRKQKSNHYVTIHNFSKVTYSSVDPKFLIDIIELIEIAKENKYEVLSPIEIRRSHHRGMIINHELNSLSNGMIISMSKYIGNTGWRCRKVILEINDKGIRLDIFNHISFYQLEYTDLEDTTNQQHNKLEKDIIICESNLELFNTINGFLRS